MLSQSFNSYKKELNGNYCRDNVKHNSERVLKIFIPIDDFHTLLLKKLGLVFVKEYPKGDGNDHVHERPGEGDHQVLSHSHNNLLISKHGMVLQLLGDIWKQISWALLEQDDTESDWKHFEASNWLSKLECFVELQAALRKILK